MNFPIDEEIKKTAEQIKLTAEIRFSDYKISKEDLDYFRDIVGLLLQGKKEKESNLKKGIVIKNKDNSYTLKDYALYPNK